MRYFHRTQREPEAVLAFAARHFGARLAITAEEADVRAFAGTLGQVRVAARPEGGHATMVTIETNQPGESELDKVAKRFLTLLHASEDPRHRPIGAY